MPPTSSGCLYFFIIISIGPFRHHISYTADPILACFQHNFDSWRTMRISAMIILMGLISVLLQSHEVATDKWNKSQKPAITTKWGPCCSTKAIVITPSMSLTTLTPAIYLSWRVLSKYFYICTCFPFGSVVLPVPPFPGFEIETLEQMIATFRLLQMTYGEGDHIHERIKYGGLNPLR